MEKQRPYISLKWAETSDGFIAKENHDSKWISNEYSRQLVHKWRTEDDAVLVGSKTAVHDNPELNVRDWSGRNPVRVVLDRFLRLNDSLHLFDRSQKTLCYNVVKHEERTNLSLVLVEERNFIQNVMEDLYKRKIQSVIVEGGATILQVFIDSGLWDEAKVFVSDKSFGKGIKSPQLNGNLIGQESVFNDTLRTYHPLHGKNQHS